MTAMKDDGESLLDNVTLRGAPPELRGRVLSAVAQELSIDIVPSWERRIGRLVAAAVVIGVVLNLWAVRTNDRRLAQLAGPRPVPKQVLEIVEIVESVTGSGTGGWVQQRLVKAWVSRPALSPQGMQDWMQRLNDLEYSGKVQFREKIQEVPEKRSNRARRADRDSFDHQLSFDFNGRQTA